MRQTIWTGTVRHNASHFKDENGSFIDSNSLAAESGFTKSFFDFPDQVVASLIHDHNNQTVPVWSNDIIMHNESWGNVSLQYRCLCYKSSITISNTLCCHLHQKIRVCDQYFVEKINFWSKLATLSLDSNTSVVGCSSNIVSLVDDHISNRLSSGQPILSQLRYIAYVWHKTILTNFIRLSVEASQCRKVLLRRTSSNFFSTFIRFLIIQKNLKTLAIFSEIIIFGLCEYLEAKWTKFIQRSITAINFRTFFINTKMLLLYAKSPAAKSSTN